MSIKQDILLTVDNVVFTIIKGKLCVLLINRLIEPFKGDWAIPGGFVLDDESIETAAYRELEEETNVKGVYLEQLYTFGDLDRDPRGRVVSVAYMAIVARENVEIKAGTDAGDVKFFPIDELPELAFDHKKVLEYAIIRLRYKLEYTNVANFLLPAKFTLRQLQDVYENVFAKEFDVRNFRKKIDKLGLVQETGELLRGQKNRPAKLYEFIDKDLKIVDII